MPNRSQIYGVSAATDAAFDDRLRDLLDQFLLGQITKYEFCLVLEHMRVDHYEAQCIARMGLECK